MIKITKDNDVKIVTKGAYKSFYEHLGYKIINNNKNSNNVNNMTKEKSKETKQNKKEEADKRK